MSRSERPPSILGPLQGVTEEEAHDVVRRLQAAMTWRARRNCYTCARDWYDLDEDYHYCLVLQGSDLYAPVMEWVDAHVATEPGTMPRPEADGCPGWVPRAYLAPVYGGEG